MSRLGRVGLAWGLLGTLAALLEAMVRLSKHFLEAVREGLPAHQWAALVAWAVFLGFFEGYRGFQRSFSPRLVARAWHLAEHPTWATVIVAPLYCAALTHATRRRLVGSWVVVASIVTLVLIIRQLEQPARGIIDAGVLVGLGWGVVSIVVFALRRARGAPVQVSLDLR